MATRSVTYNNLIKREQLIQEAETNKETLISDTFSDQSKKGDKTKGTLVFDTIVYPDIVAPDLKAEYAALNTDAARIDYLAKKLGVK